jgi:hypothetical protein
MTRSPRRKGKEERSVLYRGKALDRSELQRIRRIVRRAKGQNRRQLSEGVCRAFGWYRPNGELRETSVRALLRRLEKRGLIRLPSDVRRAQLSKSCTDRTPVAPGVAPPEWPEFSHPSAEQGLVVRPILAGERRAWREHMECYHYLGCGRLVGESICYAALFEGRVVGLLG